MYRTVGIATAGYAGAPAGAAAFGSTAAVLVAERWHAESASPDRIVPVTSAVTEICPCLIIGGPDLLSPALCRRTMLDRRMEQRDSLLPGSSCYCGPVIELVLEVVVLSPSGIVVVDEAEVLTGAAFLTTWCALRARWWLRTFLG